MQICHINLAKGFRGGERQTLLLLEGLSRASINQSLICRKNSDLAKKAKSIKGLSVIEIRKPFLLHIGKVTGSDLIHAHEGRSTHFAYYASTFSKIPYVITRRIPNNPRSAFLTRNAYKHASHIVALSSAIKQRLHIYIECKKCSIIPSMHSDLSSNPESSNAIKAKFKGKTIVGHIGALVDHHKGQTTIIRAAKQLQATHPNIVFLLLGKGKDEAKLREESRDLSNLEFVGFVDNVGDYLAAFDYFIFPSNEEGLGSILLDAMQYKIPIIASSVDGIPDIIKNEFNGLLIKPKDYNALADNIIRLINNPELAERLTKNALSTIENYSVESIANRYIELYQALLSSKN